MIMQMAKTKIWEAAAKKGSGRPVLEGVHYNAERGRLEAADGFIMALCPVVRSSDEPGEGGIVPVEVVKDAYKMGRNKDRIPTIEQDKGEFIPGSMISSVWREDLEFENGQAHPAVEGKYPDCNQILPRLELRENFEHVITLNAALLYRLAKAICESDRNTSNPELQVRLYKDKTGLVSPLIVRPGPFELNQQNMGMIMPVSDDNPPKA